jgi:hypothetical protein
MKLQRTDKPPLKNEKMERSWSIRCQADRLDYKAINSDGGAHPQENKYPNEKCLKLISRSIFKM